MKKIKCVSCGLTSRNSGFNLCPKCYNKNYYKIKGKKPQWFKQWLNNKDKETIRLILLRYKYGVETELDALLLTHFYFIYKKDEGPLFEQYNIEKFILKIRKLFKQYFI